MLSVHTGKQLEQVQVPWPGSFQHQRRFAHSTVKISDTHLLFTDHARLKTRHCQEREDHLPNLTLLSGCCLAR